MRGQTTVEFIILFAAVLIALAFLGFVLDIFPSIGENTVRTSYAFYWNEQDIGILAYAFNETAGVVAVINNREEDVSILNITLDAVLANDTEILLQPQEQAVIPVVQNQSGVPFDVVITYRNEKNGQSYVLIGGAPLT